MCHFAVITVQVFTDTGAQGLGYTCCVGKTGGAAIYSLIERDLAPLVLGEELREQTRSNLAAGFRAVKMKLGRPLLEEDVARAFARRHWSRRK
jgi:L-alanine-DL-glutamate epimerase-like enolase superfamily enzyme